MKTLFWVTIALWIYIIGGSYLPLAEGKAFPVVQNVEITRAEQVEPISTRIWGRFEKVRDCDFLSVEFFLGDTRRSSRAQLVFEEGNKVRGNGIEEFGPWVVQLTESQLSGNAYAIATHSCHPFWETVTIFY